MSARPSSGAAFGAELAWGRCIAEILDVAAADFRELHVPEELSDGRLLP